MNVYIGNLSRTVTEADLEVIFEGLGHIVFTHLVPGAHDHDARG
ncbi:MAG: RNA-binding protein, partial [Acidiferrobacter sp.]